MALVAKTCVAMMEAAGHVPVPVPLDGAAASVARRMIQLYQRHLARHAGRRCLFGVSCSEHAIRAFASQGWRGGLRASLARIRRCGGSYSLASDVHGRLTLLTGDGTEFEDDDLAPSLSREHDHRHCP